MADIGTSVILASVLVGMISIPAAAQDLDAGKTVSSDLSSISSSKNVPSSTVTRSTQDSFVRKVETAFSKFGAEISSDSAKTMLERSGSRLQVERTPDSTAWKLETSEGALKVTSTSNGIERRTETPYGVLEVKTIRGTKSVNFTGSNRTRVEEVTEVLESQMQRMKQEIRERNARMVQDQISAQQYSEYLEIEVKPETPEYVRIDNQLSAPVDLEGWNLTDEVSGYSFSEVSVPSRGTVYVYSDEEPEDLERQKDANYVFETGISWNDGGDTATLWRNGEKIVQEAY